MEMITSASNEQVKKIRALNARAKIRREEGLFVAEGTRLFREIPPKLREHVYVSESFYKEHADILSGICYDVLEENLFRRVCDTRTPQGILTLVKIPEWSREDLLGTGENAPLILVLEDLQDPGNFGTMIRTSEAAGVTGVIVSAGTADLYQPKVIRSTMGSIFRVPVCREEDPAETVRWLKEKKIRVFGAHLKGSRNYVDQDYTEGTAFCIGNEGNGLSEKLTGMLDCRIKIPMDGQVESLNAAVSAAVLLYTAHAQRTAGYSNH